VIAGILAGLVIVLFAAAVIFCLVRDPDPVEPAPLESGEPRERVRLVIDRDAGR
jgi:hypothetical protein